MKGLVSLLIGWLLLLVTVANCANTDDSENLTISVQAEWHKTPFKLNVLESVASVNNSLYEELVLKLLGIEYDHDNEEYNLDEDFNEIGDVEFYEFAIGLLESSSNTFLADISISNVLQSPRIEAQFKYYQDDVKYTHNCVNDAVIIEPIGTNIYCDKDAAFMLQNHDLQMYYDDFKLPFDRMLGDIVTPKTYIIYGDFRDRYFRVMFFNMYQFVNSGKFNLVWRYVNKKPSMEYESLSGYSVSTNVKDKEADLKKLWLNAINDISNSKTPLNRLDEMVSNPELKDELTGQGDHEIDLSNIISQSGLYLNNLRLEDSLDFIDFIDTIKSELNIQKNFRELGIDMKDTLEILHKYQDLVVAKEENSESRFDISKTKDAIVFLNDLEHDEEYYGYKSADYLYQDLSLNGDLPNARQNIHQIVFMIQLTELPQLTSFLSFFDYVKSNDLPIQVGVLPLVDRDSIIKLEVNSKLYDVSNTSGSRGCLAFLTQLNSTLSSGEISMSLLDGFRNANVEEDKHYRAVTNAHELFKLDCNQPQINVNGIFYPLTEVDKVMQQILEDAKFLHDEIMEDKIPYMIKLKTHLRKNAIPLKNKDLFPESSTSLKSQFMVAPSFKDFEDWNKDQCMTVTKISDSKEPLITLNLIGSFRSKSYVDQLKEALEFLTLSIDMKLVIYDIEQSKEFLKLKQMTEIKQQIEYLNQFQTATLQTKTTKSLNIFGVGESDSEDHFLVLAGRKIKLNEIITRNQLVSFIHHERTNRMRHLWGSYQRHKASNPLNDAYAGFELFAWTVSSSVSHAQSDRRIPSELDTINPHIHKAAADELLHLTVAIDPISHQAGFIMSIVSLLKDQDFVTVEIYFAKEGLNDNPKIRKYLCNTNPLERKEFITFSNNCDKSTVDLQLPSNWIVQLEDDHTARHFNYKLSNILVEGHVYDHLGTPLVGAPLCFNENSHNGISLNTQSGGYFQVLAYPGLWTPEIQANTRASIIYKVADESLLGVIGFEKNSKTISLQKNKFMENQELDENDNSNLSIFEKLYFKFKVLTSGGIAESKLSENSNVRKHDEL